MYGKPMHFIDWLIDMPEEFSFWVEDQIAVMSPLTIAVLTPPTIEIVGFPGGGGKAYHHAAYKAASYAVSHHPLRV